MMTIASTNMPPYKRPDFLASAAMPAALSKPLHNRYQVRWFDGGQVLFSERFFLYEDAKRWAIENVPAIFTLCAVVTLTSLEVVDATLVSPGMRK